MEATPDDPPESHDQNNDADTELVNQTPETADNDHDDPDEMQSGESGADNSPAEDKPSEKSPCKMQQGAIFSGKILSFCCSECKGDSTYSPNDLLKHFQGAHKGSLPTYPCDLCSFVTNEFSSLQRHRIGHRDTLVTCEICNDGVQYSLLLLTRHFIMCHSCNGLFRCKKCDFSTRDAGTFVQHIHHHNEGSHKCVRCPNLSPTQGKVSSGTFPFTCQFCGYGAARREYLNKHLAVAHGDDVDRWKTMDDNSGVNSSGLKLLLKKSPAGGSREPQWMSKLNALPGVSLLDHNGRLFNPEKTLEETQQFLERAVGVKKEGSKWSKSPLRGEPPSSNPVTPTSPQPKIQDNELSSGSGVLSSGNSNGLTVLMVKNKISIPPNCTTKVVGFKVVDGKKHLVLKVIPTKQESSTKNDVPEDSKKTASYPCSPVSPRAKSLFSLDSQKDFTASIKLETHDAEKDTGYHLPLSHEHEANPDRISIAASQDGDDALEKFSQLLSNSSTTTKEASFSMNHDSHPDKKSTQHDHKLSAPDPPADESQSSNSTATAVEITPTDTTGMKSAASETFANHDTAVDSEMEEMSQSTANEPTSREVISHLKSDLILLSASDAQPPALASNCSADDATPSAASGVSTGQMGHLVHNRSCNDDSAEEPSARERTVGKSSPRTPLKESLPSISDNEEKQSPEKEASLSDCTATTVSFSNLTNGKSSQTDSVTDLILPNGSSSNKKLSSVLDSESSGIAPNDAVSSDVSPHIKTSALESSDAKDCNTEAETLQNSPCQEVFSFHNYSKDSFSSSPDSLEADEQSPEEEGECDEDFGELKLAPDWSLTLPASPPLVTEEENAENGGEGRAGDDLASSSEKKALERVSDSDIEVDECIATVEEDDLAVPVLPETEKVAASSSESGKKEKQGESAPIEKGTAALSNAAVLGKILEKHSDAIISQQLEKDRMVSSAAAADVVRPTKTTLRILQTPEGKQQMFLQTTETPYAVPVQLKHSPGFKLITKSCASKVNVSYMKPGTERPNKGTGLSLTLNGGRIGMSTQGSSGEGEGHPSVVQAVSSSGGRYFLNASALKGPLLLSSAVKPASGEQTANTPQTCYLVQRPLPVAPLSNEPNGSASQTVLTTRPLLAMPVNSADKAAPLQTGRQAYLVRYISPAKSGILLNNSDAKGANQGSHASEGGKNRVFLKILRGPNGTKFLSTAPYDSAKKPIYVAASSLQSPYFLMSSNKSFASLSAGLKTSSTHKLIPAKLKNIAPQTNINMKSRGEDSVVIQKSPLSSMYSRPRNQRKRRSLFEESLETSKVRRISGKSSAEKEVVSEWEPAAKDVERTLRLSPFRPLQQIKFPKRNQPVVVLNHPDADIPEVANIMKSVNRYKSEVVKVALSPSTVKALSELSLIGPDGTPSKAGSRALPLGSNVRERFILKLKLKKTTRSKYEVVRLTSTTGSDQMPTFNCWFCGRVFNNQEDWIGHGQRHLMEATRDWNKLF